MAGPSGTVLVGYDGSAEARAALAFAEGYARIMDGRVVLAYVEGLGPYDLPASGPADAAHERAEQELETVAAAVRERGVHTEARPVLFGSPARGLQALATTEQPGLLVVGSSHRGRVGTALVGTVAIRLLHGAPCPIAIAPKLPGAESWSPRTVGVAYDGSPEARLALDHAAGVANAAKAHARVLVIAESWTTPAVELPVDTSAIAAQTRERATQWLTEARGRLAELGCTGVEGDVIEGEPPQALAHATGELDLLVLGSRAFGPVKRVLLGSVASYVLSHAACPVIVTPRTGAVPDPGADQAAASAG